MQKELTMSKEIDKKTYIDWFREMYLIREFETKCQMLYGRDKIRGFLHLYIGEEAVATGLFSVRKKDDKVITAYRDHGHALAAGMDPKIIMAELFGKKDGSSKGKGGSMHFFSKEHNFFGGHAIVGAVKPLGTGIAFAEKYKGTGNVCFACSGDGAAMQGSLHESFNMAAVWKLPIVYIIENNHYGMGTDIGRISATTDLYKLGEVYGIPSEPANGMDVVEVYKTLTKAAEHVRSGHGPYLIEFKTYRYKGHSISDPAKYRTKEELEEYKEKDPIVKIKKMIKEKNFLTDDEIKGIEKEMKDRVKEAIDFAENSPFPDPEDMYKDIYVQEDYPYLKD